MRVYCSSISELLCKLGFLVGIFVNLAGLLGRQHFLRQLGLLSSSASLACLLIAWHLRLGCASGGYALSVVLGLVSVLIGDLLLAQPLLDYLDYLGYSWLLGALVLFAAAVSLPSRPMLGSSQYMTGPADPVRVKLHRALWPAIFAVGTIAAWAVTADGARGDPRFVAAACTAIAQAALVWRALARVGYSAALPANAKGIGYAVSSTAAGRAHRNPGDRASARRGSDAPRPRVRFAPTKSGATDGAGGEDDEYSSGEDAEGDRNALHSNAAFEAGNGVGVGSGSGSGSSTGAPTPSGGLSSEVDQSASIAAGELELRSHQWCGVAGAVALSCGLLALGYDRFWLEDAPDADGSPSVAPGEPTGLLPTAVTVAYTLLLWLGQTLMVLSVPFRLPKRPSLADPAATPTPVSGTPLRVAILLPSTSSFDVSEVAITWWVLTRRGHRVVFVTRDGGAGVRLRGLLPTPFAPTLLGYGCAAAAAEEEAAAAAAEAAGAVVAAARRGAAALSSSSSGSASMRSGRTAAAAAAAAGVSAAPRRGCSLCSCLWRTCRHRLCCSLFAVLCCISCPCRRQLLQCLCCACNGGCGRRRGFNRLRDVDGPASASSGRGGRYGRAAAGASGKGGSGSARHAQPLDSRCCSSACACEDDPDDGSIDGALAGLGLGLDMGLAPGSMGVGAASEVARAAYAAMLRDAAFRSPLAWSAAAEERAHAALRAEAAALARAGASGAGSGSGSSSASARRAARVAKRSASASSSGPGSGSGMRSAALQARPSKAHLRAMRAAGIVDGQLIAPVSVSGAVSEAAADGAWDDDDDEADGRHDEASTGRLDDGHAAGGGSGSTSRHFIPESVDGLVIVGAYPAAANDRLWDDADLRGAVARFWGAEKPLAVFGSAVLLLARLHYASDGLPLLWGRMATALPQNAERCNALLHALCGCACADACCNSGSGSGSGSGSSRVPRAPLPRGALAARESSSAALALAGSGAASGSGGRLVGSATGAGAAGRDTSMSSWGAGGDFDTSATSAAATAGLPFAGANINGSSPGGLVVFPSVEAEVRASLRLPGAMFVPAPPLLCSPQACASLCIRSDFTPVRPADPLRPETAVVVEDGALFTAQGGGDAFVLAHRFLTKLEQVQRSF